MSLDKWLGITRKDPLANVSGKPLGPRNLQSMHPGWKSDIVGDGSHFKISSDSVNVVVSSYDTIFLKCIEVLGTPDGEAIWNKFYDVMRMEYNPSGLWQKLNKLTERGLIERIPRGT